jgi:hypothetical protein
MPGSSGGPVQWRASAGFDPISWRCAGRTGKPSKRCAQVWYPPASIHLRRSPVGKWSSGSTSLSLAHSQRISLCHVMLHSMLMSIACRLPSWRLSPSGSGLGAGEGSKTIQVAHSPSGILVQLVQICAKIPIQRGDGTSSRIISCPGDGPGKAPRRRHQRPLRAGREGVIHCQQQRLWSDVARECASVCPCQRNRNRRATSRPLQPVYWHRRRAHATRFPK